MKNAFICAAVLTTAVSCSKSNNTPAPVPSTDTLPALEVTVTGSHAYSPNKTVQGDSTYNLLGYGYDVTGKYADSASVKHQVINTAAFVHDFPGRFDFGYLRSAGMKPEVASNATELAASTYYTLVKDYQFAPFKSAVTTYFPASDALSAKYVYGSYESYNHQQRLMLNAGSNNLKPYLTASFLQDVQNLQPADLVKKYGTHILTGVVLGAKFKAVYQAETSATANNRTAAANAGFSRAIDSVFKVFTGNLDSLSYADLRAVTHSKIAFEIIGGDLSKVSSNYTLAIPRVYIQDWWATSSTNSLFVDLPDNALIDITDLIENATKKEAVKNYIITYLKSQEAKLVD